MASIAFSTVACPDWTLDRVAQFAAGSPFHAVELRTFGVDSRSFACDPALTGPEKVRRMFSGAGASICSLATGTRFDAPVMPPVIGALISDDEVEVREACRAIELAAQLGCPAIRVFAHDIPERESRGSALARITRRLTKVLDHARNTPVRVMLENGGGFPSVADLTEIIERVDHPLLGASYSLVAGLEAGDDPVRAISALGTRLMVARVKDLADGRPTRVGDGDVPVEAFVEALGRSGFGGTIVYEWDRAWFADIETAEAVLPDACKVLFEWQRRSTAGGRVPAMA